MKGRVVGIIAALVLAAIGTALLVAYVQSAKDDAVADEEQVEVYVVTDTIERGTYVGDMDDSVELTSVPVRLKAPGAVTDLEELDPQLVAAVQLLPGEQLVTSRLVDESTLSRVNVPVGLQELTVSLEPERAVGGVLAPGSTVGVLMSFEPFTRDASGNPGTDTEEGVEVTDTSVPTKTPNITTLRFSDVLVTAVQYGRSDAEEVNTEEDDEGDDSTDSDVAEAPEQRILITLAVTAPQAERIVFAAEFGRLWLTSQNSQTDDTGTGIVTLDQIFAVEVPQ
jgi:pilus assembly protein CpaB